VYRSFPACVPRTEYEVRRIQPKFYVLGTKLANSAWLSAGATDWVLRLGLYQAKYVIRSTENEAQGSQSSVPGNRIPRARMKRTSECHVLRAVNGGFRLQLPYSEVAHSGRSPMPRTLFGRSA
jgi:hypothetical protein